MVLVEIIMATDRKRRKTVTNIRTPSQAIDAIGGTADVAAWLRQEPHTVSGWRRRGIARGFYLHFYLTLRRRGFEVSPSVFGIDEWSTVTMPRKGNSRKRAA